jgi:hypothetical protein
MTHARRPSRLLLVLAGLGLGGAGVVGLWRVLAARQPTESLLADLARRPDAMVAGALVLLGLASFLLLPVVGRARRPADAAGEAASEPASPPVEPLIEVTVNGVLVNLPREADVARLETAPPLGPRQHVFAAVAAALPGLEFDARGEGAFTRPGYTLRIACERGDPVPTAVVRARGDGGALLALRRLTAKTGWRLFIPSRCAFLDAIPDRDLLSPRTPASD